jgi:hypothetical protein
MSASHAINARKKGCGAFKTVEIARREFGLLLRPIKCLFTDTGFAAPQEFYRIGVELP